MPYTMKQMLPFFIMIYQKFLTNTLLCAIRHLCTKILHNVYAFSILSLCSIQETFGADVFIPLYDEALNQESNVINSQINRNKLIPINPKQSGISLHYINSFMQHSSFDIISHGAGIEYNTILQNTSHYDILFSYQVNFAHTTLQSDTYRRDSSLSIGTFGAFDFLFNQTQKGHHVISMDFGYSAGIPQNTNSMFDEHTVLINLDYGYHFTYQQFSFMPYIRLESYIFFPTQYRHNIAIDGGMNAIIGLKSIWDISLFECSFAFGFLSDLNVSGSSVGILADNTIVYDTDGISNGIFAELNLGIFEYKNFHFLIETNVGYMLSYYEVNIKTMLSLLYRF